MLYVLFIFFMLIIFYNIDKKFKIVKILSGIYYIFKISVVDYFLKIY